MPPSNSEQEKVYLGDGVYAAIDRGMLRLTAENGLSATDTIYLEPEVYAALTVYLRKCEIWP